MEKNVSNAESSSFLKKILLVLFVTFAATTSIFSSVVLFSDFVRSKPLDPAQLRGMFTVFAYRYIDEIHPYESAPGTVWGITDINFKSDHLAVAETTDGISFHTLEFIFTVENPNVRIMRINDVTANDAQDAQIALIRFLDFLRKGNFEQAALYYGGPVSRLQQYGNDPKRLAAGLEGYCKTISVSSRCLPFHIAEGDINLINGTYSFIVTFFNEDGTKYRSSGGKDEFTSIVENTDGNFLVITLPFD